MEGEYLVIAWSPKLVAVFLGKGCCWESKKLKRIGLAWLVKQIYLEPRRGPVNRFRVPCGSGSQPLPYVRFCVFLGCISTCASSLADRTEAANINSLITFVLAKIGGLMILSGVCRAG